VSQKKAVTTNVPINVGVKSVKPAATMILNLQLWMLTLIIVIRMNAKYGLQKEGKFRTVEERLTLILFQ
jgi:hypothetical protein